MSWGIRITLLYLGFVALIVSMVVMASMQNIDLEYKDYYARELNYQDKIDAIHNEQSLQQSIDHQVKEKAVYLKEPSDFLSNDFQGELHFYCPSDAAKDLILPMSFDANGEIYIDRNRIKKGMYKLRMSWTMNDKSYFKEIVLNL